MSEPAETIEMIHRISAAEVWFDIRLNGQLSHKTAQAAMERVRVKAFKLFVGRAPTAEELAALLDGDS